MKNVSNHLLFKQNRHLKFYFNLTKQFCKNVKIKLNQSEDHIDNNTTAEGSNQSEHHCCEN